MYNLLEYSSDYSGTTGSLWFYSKFEATSFNADISYNNSVNNFKSFEYKDKLLPNTVAQPAPNNNKGILKNAIIDVLLKYLSDFWQPLEMPLINCKVELKRKRTKYCVLAVAGNNSTNSNPDIIIFTIKDTKLYVPVVIYQ